MSFTINNGNATLFIATDSEWDDKTIADDGLPLGWLCTSFYNGTDKALYWNGRLSDSEQDNIIAISKQEDIASYFVAQEDDTDILACYISTLKNKASKGCLLMFYSPKDIEYAIGWKAFDKEISAKRIIQRRNISGSFMSGGCRFSIKDMKGWQGIGGLKALLEATDVASGNKDKMDDYKSAMYKGFKADTTSCIQYSMADAVDTFKAYFAFIRQMNAVEKTLKISEERRYTRLNMPMTTGSIVAKTLEKWMATMATDKKAFDIALMKMGMLDTTQDNIEMYREQREMLLAEMRNISDVSDIKWGKMKNAKYNKLGYSLASVETFARKQNNSSVFAAPVHGGRCNNERPDMYTIAYAADPDMSGCYGNAMALQHFCLGKPRVISYIDNASRPSFGDVYAQLTGTKETRGQKRNKLTDGQWKAVVNGTLSFPQDIIYSKLVTADDINKAVFSGEDNSESGATDRDDDVSKIDSGFALLRKQIANGVITSDIYKIAWNVASPKERKELNALKLETFIYYDKADKCDSLDEWIAAILSDNGIETTEKDSRTFAYFPLPLSAFTGTLVAERGKLKDAMKAQDISAEEKRALSGQQQAIKLFINTLYGDTASIFKDISNVVLADNVTGKARVGAYMMAKGLGAVQTITDGGFIPLLSVPTRSGRDKDRPSLATFANMKDIEKHRDIILKPLAGKQWRDKIDALDIEMLAAIADISEDDKDAIAKAQSVLWKRHLQELDNDIAAHLETFWKPLGVSFVIDIDGNEQAFPYKIECKEHTTKCLAYWGKADYAYRAIGTKADSKPSFALRGKDGNVKERAASFTLLENILKASDSFPTKCEYVHGYLLKIGKYVTAKNSKGFTALDGKHPGDNIEERRIQRFNNGFIQLDTEDGYDAITDRKGYAKGEHVPFFERFADEGISDVHTRMLDNNMRPRKYS